MHKPFIQHLIEASAKPIKEDVFLQGYQAVLAGVAQDQTFSLYGMTVRAPSGVYSPHETSSTRFLMDHFFALGLDRAGGDFLEVGCGAGAVSLLAARHGWNVTATDIDQVAVEATRENAQANGLKLRALQSDLFDALGAEQFDVIVFNQPFFHVPRPIGVHERTLSDEGGGLHVRFMAQALKHLKPGGYVVVAYSNCSNTSVFNQPGWDMELRSFDFDAGSDYIRAHFKATPTSRA